MIETVSAKTGTVALYVDMVRESARRVAGDVAASMRAAGFEVALCEDQDRELQLASNGASVEDAVVLVTIGGDGTLLRAAQIAAPLRLPLFGINTGRLGLSHRDGRTDGRPHEAARHSARGAVDRRTAAHSRRTCAARSAWRSTTWSCGAPAIRT